MSNCHQHVFELYFRRNGKHVAEYVELAPGRIWMITDNQVRKRMKHLQQEETLGVAAAKAGMDEKTACKYRDLETVLPSDIKAQRLPGESY